MKRSTFAITALAAGMMCAPVISNADNMLDSCVQAFMAQMSGQTTATLKLRNSHYESDVAFMPLRAANGSLSLTAHDAHDNHAVAHALCTINSHGAVTLQAEPVTADNLP
jgi:hypothetical protein